jgi:hypothetical protein
VNYWLDKAVECVISATHTSDRKCTSLELVLFLLSSWFDLCRLIARLQERSDLPESALDKFWSELSDHLAVDNPAFQRGSLSEVDEVQLVRHVLGIGQILSRYFHRSPDGKLTEAILMEMQETCAWANRGAVTADRNWDGGQLKAFVESLRRPADDSAAEDVA